MVSRPLWERIETIAGPHTIDLMALDSNAQCSRHYTPFPTSCSTGTNFFAQNPCHTSQGDDENGYLFPPAFLIGPALQHIREIGALTGSTLDDIVDHVGWRSHNMAKYYLQLHKSLQPASVAAKMALVTPETTVQYEELNQI